MKKDSEQKIDLFPEAGEAGFSLIEVLMAMTIMAVALLPMSQAYITSWQTSMRAGQVSRAQMFGRWKVSEIMAMEGYDVTDSTGDFGEEWDESGVDDEDYGVFEYTVQTEDITGGNDDFKGKQVRLRIEFPDPITGAQRTIHCGDLDACERYDFVFAVTDKHPVED